MAGRPRRFTPPADMDHLPLDEPLENLSPSVRALLDAGRRILEEHGFGALTLEAVANEAGASKATLVAHFGNRAGFVAMLFDSLMGQETVELVGKLRAIPEDDADAAHFVSSLGALYGDPEETRAYFEIASNAMRDTVLRARLSRLFDWYREVRIEGLRRCAGTGALSDDEVAALATLVNAAEDGLAFQRSMDDGFDHQPTLDLLARLVELYLGDRAASDQA